MLATTATTAWSSARYAAATYMGAGRQCRPARKAVLLSVARPRLRVAQHSAHPARGRDVMAGARNAVTKVIQRWVGSKACARRRIDRSTDRRRRDSIMPEAVGDRYRPPPPCPAAHTPHNHTIKACSRYSRAPMTLVCQSPPPRAAGTPISLAVLTPCD